MPRACCVIFTRVRLPHFGYPEGAQQFTLSYLHKIYILNIVLNNVMYTTAVVNRKGVN